MSRASVLLADASVMWRAGVRAALRGAHSSTSSVTCTATSRKPGIASSLKSWLSILAAEGNSTPARSWPCVGMLPTAGFASSRTAFRFKT